MRLPSVITVVATICLALGGCSVALRNSNATMPGHHTPPAIADTALAALAAGGAISASQCHSEEFLGCIGADAVVAPLTVTAVFFAASAIYGWSLAAKDAAPPRTEMARSGPPMPAPMVVEPPGMSPTTCEQRRQMLLESARHLAAEDGRTVSLRELPRCAGD